MNYYPFHIGDYAAHTGHLDPMEDLAYRRMLDVYYLNETPLPEDAEATARLVRIRGNVAEVRAVLNEFFYLTPDGWRHRRCDEELARMQDKQAKARVSAAASVNARRANVERTLNARSTNVELPTPTPTPTPNQEAKASLSQLRQPRPAKKAPASFSLTAELRSWAVENAAGVNIEAETAKFIDHTFATARSDWAGTWRNWMRKASETPLQRIRTASGAPNEPEWVTERKERSRQFLGPSAAKPVGRGEIINMGDISDAKQLD